MASKTFVIGSFRVLSLVVAFAVLLCPIAIYGEAGSAAFPQRGWKAVGPAPGAIPAAIAAHARSGTIYIGSLQGGLLKSTDGGAHFVSVYDGGVPSMVMDPNDPNVVYAGGAKTIDGGVTWNFQAGGGGLVMAMDPANPNVAQKSGHTPLDAARHNQDAELERLLIEFGAQPAK